jgi:hypothetical protein
VRRLVTGAGVVAVCAGVAVVVTNRVGPFDLNYAFVTLVGLLALVQGLRYAGERRVVDYPAATTDDPELRWRAPVPGTEFDEGLASATGFPSIGTRDRVRDRIREAVVELLASRDGVPEERAEEVLREGTWTDDPVAAHFVGGDVDLPLGTSIRALLRGESRFTYGARRAVAALADLEAES